VGLAVCVLAGVLASAVLTLLTSVLLIGLPHGWTTATSWADVPLRFSWIVRFVVPAAVTVQLTIRLRDRARTRRRGDGPRPPKRGGLHR